MSSFRPIIDRFGNVPTFAREIGMTVGAAKQARKRDSISSEWFSAVVRAAARHGFSDITEARLAIIAEQRRLARETPERAAA